MVAEIPQPRSVTLSRVFDAPRELVFRAWTEAEHVVRWMKCDVSASLRVENWVAEVGNEFSTFMTQPGVFEVRGGGRFTAVEPPGLLEYVLDADPSLEVPEMTVRVEFQDVGGRTEVTLTQSGIPSDFIFGVINGGWTASLAQLETVLRTADSSSQHAVDGPSDQTGHGADQTTATEALP